MIATTLASVGKACGTPKTYENILTVDFAAPADASLPPASTSTLTIRMNHRREGWRTFTFTLPTLASAVAAGVPATTVAPATTQPTVDVTGIGTGKRKP